MTRALLIAAVLIMPLCASAVLVDDSETVGAGDCNSAYTTDPPLGDVQTWYTNMGMARAANYPSTPDHGATYIRNGWVLGIDHSGDRAFIVIGGVTYGSISPIGGGPPGAPACNDGLDNDGDGLIDFNGVADDGVDKDPGCLIGFGGYNDGMESSLRIYKIRSPYPDVTDLQLSDTQTALGTLIHVSGVSKARGAALSPSTLGWNVSSIDPTLRWGTNHIGSLTTSTLISMIFDDLNTPGPAPALLDGDGNFECESDGNSSDSGGGILSGSGAGVLFEGVLESAAPTTSLFGAATAGPGVWPEKAYLDALFDIPNCNNGFDDDGDGDIDMADRDCSSASDATELYSGSSGGSSFESSWGTANSSECPWGVSSCLGSSIGSSPSTPAVSTLWDVMLWDEGL
jgi:hypothetical protein